MKKSNILLLYPNIVPGSPVLSGISSDVSTHLCSPLFSMCFILSQRITKSCTHIHVPCIRKLNPVPVSPLQAPLYHSSNKITNTNMGGDGFGRDTMFWSHIFIKEEQSKYTSDLWADAWLFRTQNKLSNSTGKDWNKAMTSDSLLAHQQRGEAPRDKCHKPISVP